MQAARRAARALTIALYALALAGLAHGAEGTASEAVEAPPSALLGDATAGPSEAVARLGATALPSDEPGAAGGGARALRSELERLRFENETLRSDARATDRLVGAGILAGGMLLGALLRAAAGRRPQPRIRF